MLIGLISFILGVLLSSSFIFFTYDKQNILHAIQAIGSIAIMLSAFIALISYFLNQKSRREDNKIAKSKINLDLAVELLEHAYNTLTKNNTDEIPLNDRMVWLTCARQLLASNKISKNISYDEHKYIYNEYRIYWRTKLYLFLNQHNKALNVRFFADKAKHALSTTTDERLPLSEQSLAVIFRFLEMDENEDEELIAVKKFSDEEIAKHKRMGFSGLAEHLQEFRDYMEAIKTQKVSTIEV